MASLKLIILDSCIELGKLILVWNVKVLGKCKFDEERQSSG